jgi:hypothetical protein
VVQRPSGIDPSGVDDQQRDAAGVDHSPCS